MSRVVFHIGYPKTGTTTLQKCFFNHSEVHYLGKMLRGGHRPGDPRTQLSTDLVFNLLTADTLRFEAALPAMQESISDLLRDGGSVMLSDEAFTMAEDMKFAALAQMSVISDHHVVADRLCRLWPEASILVSVREQKSFLASFYLQRLRGGMPFVSFEDYIGKAFATVARRSMLNALRYDEMHTAYTNAFGAGRIKVVMFERYRQDFSVLIAAAAELMEVSAADAVSTWGGGHENKRGRRYSHARWMHAMLSSGRIKLSPRLYRRLHSIFTIVPESVDLDPALAAKLDDFFASSNRKFEALAGLSLGETDYALPADKPAVEAKSA